MTTLKKLKKDRLSITSKLLKKDEDFLPISPEFIKDLRDKILLENSALKLSISDYQLMCRNNKVLNMMSITLNKPKAKLKKFCKYMPVFEENISKSTKSIAYKINGINGPITNLPKEIRSTILDKFAEILPSKYVLLDWINKDKLKWEFIFSNPNAIDLLKDNQDKVDWNGLSHNTNAIDLIKERIEYENSLTKEEYNDLDCQDRIDWGQLSLNPNAIKLLEKNRNKIYWDNLSLNPNAIDLLKEQIKYENNLSSKDYKSLGVAQKINWNLLSKNPNAIDLLKENKDKINWNVLSVNPNAISLLKNKRKINWVGLSYNPNAIDLLEKNQDKIDWDLLSSSPNAIHLLKNNQDKINWYYLSTNPNAINLIEERIEYESTLTPKQYNNLTKFQKIDWDYISANPNAIDLLKNNQDKINWYYLSENPAIFKAV